MAVAARPSYSLNHTLSSGVALPQFLVRITSGASGHTPNQRAHLTRPVWGIDDSRLSIVDWPNPRQVDIPGQGLLDC